MEDSAATSQTLEPFFPDEPNQATAMDSTLECHNRSSDHIITNSISTLNYPAISTEKARSKSASVFLTGNDTININKDTQRPQSMPAADQLTLPPIDIDRIRKVGGNKKFRPGENRTKVLINVFENSLYGDFRDPKDVSNPTKPTILDKTLPVPSINPPHKETGDVEKSKDEISKSGLSESRSLPRNLTHLLSMKTFSNSVDVQINETKYCCSGAILAAQSPVFHYQLSKGASMIVLEGLKCKRGEERNVEECLLLLYGGGVVLSDRNIPTIIRFSVLYQVENMYRLALEWARNCISVVNVYPLWLLGSEPGVKEKRKKKKNDLLHICRHFVRGKEVEIAFQLKKVKERGEEVKEEFVFLMLQYTDCASTINELL
ncbi:hypothetical protein ACHWQZ_G009449 [Mnemiopsis leidyi]